jgi:hypothetical protein
VCPLLTDKKQVGRNGRRYKIDEQQGPRSRPTNAINAAHTLCCLLLTAKYDILFKFRFGNGAIPDPKSVVTRDI